MLNRFGGAVAPSASRRRSEDAVVFLGEGGIRVFAVDLRGAGYEHLLVAVLMGELKDDVRPDDDRVERPYRVIDDVLHADDGGQMVDFVAFADQMIHQPLVHHVVFEEAEFGIIEQRLDVL